MVSSASGVLVISRPARGRAVLDAYLSYLARHPATAHRLARKLAIRFVSDDPPADIQDLTGAVEEQPPPGPGADHECLWLAARHRPSFGGSGG